MTTEEFVRRLLTARFLHHGRSYDAVDCWGVVYLYYRDVLGTPVPSYVDAYEPGDVRGTPALGELISGHLGNWRRVEVPTTGDVALFRIAGRTVHVALVIDYHRALHAEEKLGTFVERLFSPLWAKRLEGVYELADG